jgi:hypothetical protein
MTERTSVRVPHHVVHRAFAEETVLLNIDSGQYHGLNPVAGRMLAVLIEVEVVTVAVSTLAAEFGEPRERIAADVERFLAGLVERGLIEVLDGDRT